MARILGLWFWLVNAAIAALVLSTALDFLFATIAQLMGWEAGDEFDLAPRWLAVAVAGLLIVPLTNPVRRWLWSLPIVGDILAKHVFEDLDGDWTVEIESNWPTVEALLTASQKTAAAPFDPVREPETIPAPKRVQFDATIRLGWDKAEVTFQPNAETTLRQSRTIVFEMIKKCADYPARVFWGFRQFNTDVKATDEDNFIGAATLDVVSKDELVGTYWNNRSWRKGLNTAGRITMKRKL